MPEKLKKGWTRVAFGDVVEKVNETGVPTGDESRTYIGLEHLDSDSFTVSRWGSEVDLVVPKTRIKKGDVLFARRNTHLKRCAVAPFEAYFSPDGYAFRSKSPALLHELLLYIVASDGFMSYAIEHSAGTHSKRVKWTDLMRYEFALPPLDEQRRIAEVLSVVRVLDDSLAMLEESCARVLASAAAYEFDQIRNASATMVPLINICSQGPQSGIYKSEDFRGRGVLMVNMGELFGNDIIDSTVKMQRVCLDEKELLRYSNS